MLTTTTIDRQDFREAMSRFAAAVLLVTTDGPAGRRGVTVSAACSVSDDPATMLVCLNQGSVHNRRFSDNGNFAVNVLSVDGERLARAFSGEGGLSLDERFALGAWERRATGAPLLVDALVAFDCRMIENRVVATHHVMIGTVEAMRFGPKAPSLLYRDRLYHQL